jgi:hypothetical protein
VQALLKTIQLPPGYRFDIAGDQRPMQESFRRRSRRSAWR